MNCPGCRARNPIGNKFCRECGQKIPLEENALAQEEAQQAEVERARERAAQLLTKAFALSQHGKHAEALPLAEEAAELLPASTSALTLCSTLYERLNQNDKAIVMMEKVVSLNPHSAVDIDKLDRLRRGVHLLPRRPVVALEEPEASTRRWIPVTAAIGAGILALLVGVIALVKSQGKTPKVLPVTEVTGRTPANTGFFPNSNSQRTTNPIPGSVGPLAPPLAPQPQSNYRDPFQPLGNTPLATTPPPRESQGVRIGRPAGNPVLPNPRDVTSEPQGNEGSGVAPVDLSNKGGFSQRNNGMLPALGGAQRNPDAIPAGPPSGGTGVPVQSPGIPASNPGATNPPPSEGEGYIRVRPHSPGVGNEAISSSSRGGDPLLKAQTLQAVGQYREALTQFREALSAGAPVGDVQQGIALCHQRLGEKASARAAYQQAISAFEAQVRVGRSVDQASRGIAACRAALDVLGS